MNQDKKRAYILSVLYLCFLLLTCFVTNDIVGRVVLTAVSVLFSVLIFLVIKKRIIYRIEKRQVALVMASVAVISVTVYYLTGIKFGFYNVLLLPSFVWKYIIPYVVIIISSELTRSVLLAQKSKFVTAVSYISSVILDISLLSGSGAFMRFDLFMDTVGMVLFPSISVNFLYTYISLRYGTLPNILYKSIILLYPYLIPFRPAMPDAMLSFAKIAMPLVACFLIYSIYKRRKFVVSKRRSRLDTVINLFVIVLLVSCMMLISCQFKYCLIVIGSESMTGAIDKGDALIYESYDGQTVESGQVIVFIKNDTTIIHRVVDVKRINGEIRYYTKGDANASPDAGYITGSNIIGVAKFRVKYIGYPTIWVRSLFR